MEVDSWENQLDFPASHVWLPERKSKIHIFWTCRLHVQKMWDFDECSCSKWLNDWMCFRMCIFSSTFSFSKLEVFQSARGLGIFSPHNSFSVQWGFPNVCLSKVFFNIFGCPKPFVSAKNGKIWMNCSAWFLETTIVCQNVGLVQSASKLEAWATHLGKIYGHFLLAFDAFNPGTLTYALGSFYFISHIPILIFPDLPSLQRTYEQPWVHEYMTGMTLVRSSHPVLLTTLHIFSIYLLKQKSFLFHELWHPRKTNPISVPQFFLMSSYESLFAHEIQ